MIVRGWRGFCSFGGLTGFSETDDRQLRARRCSGFAVGLSVGELWFFVVVSVAGCGDWVALNFGRAARDRLSLGLGRGWSARGLRSWVRGRVRGELDW